MTHSIRRRLWSRVPGAQCLVPLVLLSCRPADAREQRDWERMRRQQRYNAFDASAVFGNGAVLQAPPPHTIPAGARAAPFYSGSADSVDAAVIPITVDSAALAHGAEQYSISCAPCHGVGGYGGGLMAANLPDKRPPSLRVAPAATLPPGTMFKVITDGFGLMPAHGWQMPPEVRWDVVAYVRDIAAAPQTVDTRADSALAGQLRHIDSIRAANKALAESVQRAPKP